ncbi:hypothetical protein L195_g016378 [Trifolium pratense]|uniref:CCHC-type domain-containing protein n=1 Tax=Trifolium pratense TaxID=57577 RepID=A0A2K3MR31_TRIPR|nr:hypothetical protein L195_g016378 [Trifolium pratense]
MGVDQNVPKIREKVDLIEKKLVRIEHEDGNRLLPKVYLDDSVFESMCSSWTDALVVKLLGKTLGYKSMKERLQRTWKPAGGFEIRDVDNGFFMVKFDMAADKEKVVSQGPWMIYDRYLAVSHWSPEFISPEAKVERTLVWIRFPGLNLVYYDESFLLAMASAVGKPIKVDTNTMNVERGKFARICVEIDLNEPVVGKVWLKGYWYKVEYEGLHIICYSCGRYGHHARNCMHRPAQPPPAAMPSQELPQNKNDEAINVEDLGKEIMEHNDDSTVMSPKKLLENNDAIKSINVQNNVHGDWMVVSRKKRNHHVAKVNNNIPNMPNRNELVSIPNNRQIKGKEVINGPNHIASSQFHLGLEHKPPKLWRKPKKRKHDLGQTSTVQNPTQTDSMNTPKMLVKENAATMNPPNQVVSPPIPIVNTPISKANPKQMEERELPHQGRVSDDKSKRVTMFMDEDTRTISGDAGIAQETHNLGDVNMGT